MKPVLFLAAAVVLAAAPALSQEPAPPPAPSEGTPPNVLSLGDLAFSGVPGFASRDRMCFDGQRIIGASSIGDRVAYVQTKRAGIFRLDMPAGCGSLKAAKKLSVMTKGRQLVCVDGPATLVVQTAGGAAQCTIDKVSRLTRTELTALTPPERR